MAFFVALSLFCVLVLTGIGIGVYIDIRTERKVMRALDALTIMHGELAKATVQAALAAAKASAAEEHVTQLARNISTLIAMQATEPPIDATGNRPAIELPRIEIETEDDRETPPDTPRAAAPQDGEGGEIAFLPLGEDTLAGIDVLAAHWRVTREEAIGWCLRTGAEHVEQHGPGSGEHYESREELAARLVEVGLHQHLAALPALAAQHAAAAAAKDRDHGEEVTRSSHREPRPRRRALVGIARARLTRIAWARTATQTKLSAGALAPLPRVGDVVALRAVVLGVELDGVLLEVPDVIEPRRVLVPLALIAGPWVPRG